LGWRLCFNDIRIGWLTMMSSNQQFLQNLYEAFNKGEIETIISAVREYWTNQYKVIQVQLETTYLQKQ
jgi:hypothetical protein